MDLEGNERADELADEGSRKHGVKLAAEGKKKKYSREEARATKEPARTAGKTTKLATCPNIQ